MDNSVLVKDDWLTCCRSASRSSGRGNGRSLGGLPCSATVKRQAAPWSRGPQSGQIVGPRRRIMGAASADLRQPSALKGLPDGYFAASDPQDS